MSSVIRETIRVGKDTHVVDERAGGNWFTVCGRIFTRGRTGVKEREEVCHDCLIQEVICGWQKDNT
jgi:hypothetical protein